VGTGKRRKGEEAEKKVGANNDRGQRNKNMGSRSRETLNRLIDLK